MIKVTKFYTLKRAKSPVNKSKMTNSLSFLFGGDNGARRNVKRFSGSLANRRKRRVYADNRHIPSHGNYLSFNPSHTKNDLKKTKSRPTTGSRKSTGITDGFSLMLFMTIKLATPIHGLQSYICIFYSIHINKHLRSEFYLNIDSTIFQLFFFLCKKIR